MILAGILIYGIVLAWLIESYYWRYTFTTVIWYCCSSIYSLFVQDMRFMIHITIYIYLMSRLWGILDVMYGLALDTIYLYHTYFILCQLLYLTYQFMLLIFLLTAFINLTLFRFQLFDTLYYSYPFLVENTRVVLMAIT